MAEPRTPRAWNAGSEEPPVGVDHLTDPLGFEMERRAGVWHYADSPHGFPWSDLDDEFAVEWPLTEVLPEPAEAPKVTTSIAGKIFPPWDDETVDALNGFQRIGGGHPFTCPGNHDQETVLIATTSSWICPRGSTCGYTQGWAYAFMADRSAWLKSPFAPAVSPNAPEPEEIPSAPFRLPSDARTWMTALLRDAAIQGWDIDTCGERATDLVATWKALPGAALPAASVVSSAPISTSAGKTAGEDAGDGRGELRAELAKLIDPAAWHFEEADQTTIGAQWRVSEGRRNSLAAADRVLTDWTPPSPSVVAETPADDRVREFVAERADYINSINNCHPDNARDYWRWNGHAEARRQLAERLGLPVTWPEAYGEVQR